MSVTGPLVNTVRAYAAGRPAFVSLPEDDELVVACGALRAQGIEVTVDDLEQIRSLLRAEAEAFRQHYLDDGTLHTSLARGGTSLASSPQYLGVTHGDPLITSDDIDTGIEDQDPALITQDLVDPKNR